MTRQQWGARLWLVRPVYFLVELVVAAAAVRYSFVDDTVSDLGAVLTSPWHLLMNAAFVGFGLLMALGAVLLAGRFGAGVTVLLVVSGASSAAVGLVPVDVHPGLHVVVAAPVFVAQPLALVLLGRRTRTPALVLAGVVSLLAGVGFLGLDLTHGSGAIERLALWPTFVALALLAHRELGADRRAGPSGR
ncbi:MAG: DUF998 domain-containing protein [Nocardioides sp.]|nr:DUF998 domain-containing protein [Nocardioides sp.]